MVPVPTYSAVLGIRDILVRIRIPGSVPLTKWIRIRLRLLSKLILRNKDAKKNFFFHILLS
jgi:hypothetical protein